MDRTRTEPREGGVAGSFGIREEAQVPARPADHARAAAEPPGRTRRRWFGIAARVVRNAAIAVLVMAAIPIGIVARDGHRLWTSSQWGRNTNEKVSRAEPMRPLLLPRDASITPMQAGVAFNTLIPEHANPNFPVLPVPVRAATPWQAAALASDMFPAARPDQFRGPSSRAILDAVAKGFTPEEMGYLRAVATSPAWKEFDLVARAPAVDFVGGRFRVPFGAGATAEQMPIPSFKAAKEFAYASASRAAYHMATGQRDSAETALRSTVSFGFALIDDGTTLIEELMGAVIVGIGREALERFYFIEHDAQFARTGTVLPDGLSRFLIATHDSRAGIPSASRPDRVPDAALRGAPASTEDWRKHLLARVTDPATHRGERFESLRALSMSSCSNVRDLLLGPRSDATDAIHLARQDLARYPSERALIDLVTQPADQQFSGVYLGPIEELAASASAVASVVLHNPRLAACTRIVRAYARF